MYVFLYVELLGNLCRLMLLIYSQQCLAGFSYSELTALISGAVSLILAADMAMRGAHKHEASKKVCKSYQMSWQRTFPTRMREYFPCIWRLCTGRRGFRRKLSVFALCCLLTVAPRMQSTRSAPRGERHAH